MKVLSLSSGKHTLVSDSDYARARRYSWFNHSAGYAYGRIDGKLILLHHFLIGKRSGMVVDHINGNKLDNRRCNIRHCSYSTNLQKKIIKRDGFRGVRWHRQSGMWQARMRNYGREVSLGYFNKPIDAAKAYNNGVLSLHGKYAILNKIP